MTALMSINLAGLSLRDLEYAAAVARARHFGRAAGQCGVSQPALSGQIRKLEALLGVTLFERAHNGVRLTPAGEALLPRLERVLAEAHGLLEMARGAAEPLTSTLRLAAIETLGPYYLPFLLRRVRAAYPALGLRLAEGRTAMLLEELRGGGTDLLLAALPLSADGLHVVPLFREPFLLAAPAGHWLAKCPEVRLADLAGADLILLEEGHCLRDQALALCAGVSPHLRQATGIETLWHMIASGEGCSLMPALGLIGREGGSDLVVARPLADPEAGRTIALIWRRTDPRGAALQKLAELLRTERPPGVIAVTPDGLPTEAG